MLSRRSPFVTISQGAQARMAVPISSDSDNLVDGLAYADVVACADVPKVPLGYMRHPMPGEDWDGPWRPVPPDGAVSALLRVEGGSLKWRDDGEEPTTDEGMPLTDGESLTYDLNTQSLWTINTDPDAVVHVLFYGYPYETEGV